MNQKHISPKREKALKRLTGVVAYVTFPLMFLLILVAKPVFVLLYSDRWLLSVPYFQVLCIAGLAICLQSINLQAITAIGKSKIVFNWVLVKRSYSLALIVGGLMIGGVWGMLWGMVVQAWFSYVINAYLVSKHIGYKLGQQLLDLLPILLLSIIAFVAGWLISLLSLNFYVTGVLEFILYVVVYFTISYIFKLSAYKDFVELIPMFTSKLVKRKKK